MDSDEEEVGADDGKLVMEVGGRAGISRRRREEEGEDEDLDSDSKEEVGADDWGGRGNMRKL